MRCKGCDAELSEIDLKRKDVDGSFMDLCGSCYGISEHHMYMLERMRDPQEEDAPPAPKEPQRKAFDLFVKRHNLRESWRSGLGLKWNPTQREAHFYDKCYREFVALDDMGYGRLKALERACGIHKANRRHEYAGASFASYGDAQELSGGMHDTTVVSLYETEDPYDLSGYEV